MSRKGTMIVGVACSNGVVLVADRMSASLGTGELGMTASKLRIVHSFVVGICGEKAPGEKVCTVLEDRLKETTCLAKALTVIEEVVTETYERYKELLPEGRLTFAVAGLDEIKRGKAKLYSVIAGLPPEEVDYMGWGIGGRYSEIGRLFFQRDASCEEVWKALTLLIVLAERVNLWVGGGIDVVLVEHGVGPKLVDSADVSSVLTKAKTLADSLPLLVERELA